MEMAYTTPTVIRQLIQESERLDTRSGATRSVLTYLLRMYKKFIQQDRPGELFVSEQKLAQNLHWAPITIKRAVRRLVRMGILQATQARRKSGQYSTNHYQIDFDQAGQVLNLWDAPSTTEQSSNPVLPPRIELDTDDLAEDTSHDTVQDSTVFDEPMPAPKENAHGEKSAQDDMTARETEQLIEQYHIKDHGGFRRFVDAHADRIDRYVDWLLACPPNHPARPRNAWAWLRAALRHHWTETPTWMKPTPAKPLQPHTVSIDHETAEQQEARRAAYDAYVEEKARERQAQQAIKALLAEDTEASHAFQAEVKAAIYHQLGGAMGEAAWNDKGPMWRVMCREVWENRPLAFRNRNAQSGTLSGKEESR